MSQQVFVLDSDGSKLSLGPQHIYGSKGIIREEELIGVVEETKTVHFANGPKEVIVLREGSVYWVRKGDML